MALPELAVTLPEKAQADHLAQLLENVPVMAAAGNDADPVGFDMHSQPVPPIWSHRISRPLSRLALQ